MPRRPASVTQADVARALRAARQVDPAADWEVVLRRGECAIRRRAVDETPGARDEKRLERNPDYTF